MSSQTMGAPFAATESLKPADFVKFSRLVYETCGIQLDVSKRKMVETRLLKRLRQTGAPTFQAYWKLLTGSPDREQELVRCIDAITTNKTDFFREARHFDFLRQRIVPEVGPKLKAEKRGLRVWSAGCSSGKEAYTLAMVLSECQREGRIDDFSILGTDICTDVLKEASHAVYSEADVEAVPAALRKRYVLRSRDRQKPTCRMTPAIRNRVTFERLNFMDEGYGYHGEFDVILCRNVMIYFDRPTQEAVVNRLGECLRPDGYFFTGHSETLNGISTPMVSVAPAIYRKERRR